MSSSPENPPQQGTPIFTLKSLPPTLKASIHDVIWFSVMMGLGESYFSACAVWIGASPLKIGLLATLPLLLGACSQLLGVSLMKFYPSRRRLVVLWSSCQALVILFLGFCLLAFGREPTWMTLLMLLSVILYSIFGQIVAPVWSSLIGDLVPEEGRAIFFGYRNKLAGLVTLIALVCGGVWLEYAGSGFLTDLAFPLLFVIAGTARLKSVHWLSRHEDPQRVQQQTDYFSFWMFLVRTKHSNFTRFVWFYSLLYLVVFIAGPYFILYMFDVLLWNYTEFMVATAVQMVFQFSTMQRWGVIIDQVGSRRVICISSVGICFIPLLWLVSPNFYFILCIQVMAGVAWAGFQLAAFSFLFDAVSPGKRARCTAYMNVLHGMGIALGGGLGWVLHEYFVRAELSFPPFLGGSPSIFFSLFLVSGILRTVVVWGLLRGFREVRTTSGAAQMRASEILFRVSSIRPWTGALFDVIASKSKRS